MKGTRFDALLSRKAQGLVTKPSRRVAEYAHAASLVINSTPTVIINANEVSDLESRVVEVLRQHREMLFEQWQRETRRRQRTEF